MKTALLLLLIIGGSVLALTQDAAFVSLTSANAAATALDAYTTINRVGHTSACPFEVWSPQLYGQKPEALRTSLVMGGLFATSALLSYGLKRHRAHIWKASLWAAPQAYLASVHTMGAIHNFRVCH